MSQESFDYSQWKLEFKSLNNEIELAMKEFIQNRNCKCQLEACRHFEIERNKIFGDKINSLYNKRLMIGLKTLTQINNPN